MSSNNKSPDKLMKILGDFYYIDNKQELDITKCNYVLYVRKSTDEAEHQQRSLGDQMSDCRELASRLGINIVKTIKESQLAKESGIRSVFTEMLDGIKLVI